MWPFATLSRHQHAVGQGGFHSARLTGPSGATWIDQNGLPAAGDDPTSISWVYDCGSENKAAVETEVDTYLDTAGPWLDLLFISHLDGDHVNGVERLFSGQPGLKVGTIAVPYLTDGARAYTLAQTIASGGEASDQDFVRQLILDPVAALTRFDPRRILLFRSGEGPVGEADPDINPTGPSAPDGERPVWKLTGPDGASPRGSTLVRTATLEATVVSDDAVLAAPIGWGGFQWIFKPYVRPQNQVVIDAFLAEAATELNKTPDEVEAMLFDPEGLKVLLTSDDDTKALGDAYKTVFKSKNNTSLCIHAGPAPQPNRQNAWAFCSDDHAYVRRETIGWLGTGDLDIKAKIWVDRFLDHYAAEKDRTRVLQIPHHGSIHNWHVDALTMNPRSCVVSASPSNPTWIHPDPTIVAQVAATGARLRHVTYKRRYLEGFILDAF